MASVSIKSLVLSLAADASQALVFVDPVGIPTQINPQPQTPGEDRMYGSGRYRSVSGGATQQQHAIALVAVCPAAVATLEAWSGQVLCLRDDSGVKYYGTFRSPQISRHSYDSNSDVSFTFTESTYSEAV